LQFQIDVLSEFAQVFPLTYVLSLLLCLCSVSSPLYSICSLSLPFLYSASSPLAMICLPPLSMICLPPLSIFCLPPLSMFCLPPLSIFCLLSSVYVLSPSSVYTLKKILERKDQYLYVARRTFTNLFLGVNFLKLLRAVPDLTQLSHENIYL
jgi:hypothetical protein